MVNITTANDNQDTFKQVLPKAKFSYTTPTHCTFNVSNKDFLKLYDYIQKELKTNPYYIIIWERI